MSDWNSDRASALMRLRRAQTRVVTGVVSTIATEAGAVATPGVMQLDGPQGGRYVGQRVRVERSLAQFSLDDAFAAAESEWNADGAACRLFVPKADGTVQLQMTTPLGEFHSVMLLHQGRVLQLTSFSEELDLPTPDESAPEAEPQLGDDDPLSADTLAQPPEFTPEHLQREAESGAEALGDPRPGHLAAELRSLGPDLGYRLRSVETPPHS